MPVDSRSTMSPVYTYNANIVFCRMTNYELLCWLAETLSCDVHATFKYDDPLLKMSHLGCALMRYFQHQVNHISMSDSLLCIICIVSDCYCIYLTLSVCFMAASINRINSAWHRNQTDFSWETLKSADTILAFTSKLYTTVNTMSAPVNQPANITHEVIQWSFSM